MSIVRGCGTRVSGGVYVETLTGPNGHPVECFVKDPPIPLDVNAIGLGHVGVKLIERNGVYHIFDWVGEGYYPNVTDFIEEVRKFGASRRLPKTLDFSKLTEQSTLVLVHSRGAWTESGATFDQMTAMMKETNDDHHPPQLCPEIVKSMHHGVFSSEHLPCSSLWWYDHDADNSQEKASGILYKREMPSLAYSAVVRPWLMPSYIPAIFMILPIHQIAIVRDSGTGSHNDTHEKINGQLEGRVPLEFVDD